jgi:hypothetical protein
VIEQRKVAGSQEQAYAAAPATDAVSVAAAVLACATWIAWAAAAPRARSSK